ncbi:MAG: hypothetical protein MI755_04740, partial [Sphingomonadales bacterium]|nr:hypothetical protein [Sphingomonadales bacterium]
MSFNFKDLQARPFRAPVEVVKNSDTFRPDFPAGPAWREKRAAAREPPLCTQGGEKRLQAPRRRITPSPKRP